MFCGEVVGKEGEFIVVRVGNVIFYIVDDVEGKVIFFIRLEDNISEGIRGMFCLECCVSFY